MVVICSPIMSIVIFIFDAINEILMYVLTFAN